MRSQFLTGFLAGCIVAMMVNVVAFIGIHDNVQHEAYMHGCAHYEFDARVINGPATFKWCDE